MATATAAAGRSIVRVAARAFSHPSSPGGGNPVTVFLSPFPVPQTTQADLAKSCEWESVVAQLPSAAATAQGEYPSFRFYMPSGEEVSFCAHAAIGAAAVLVAEGENTDNPIAVASKPTTVTFVTSDGAQQSAAVQNGEAELLMEVSLKEKIAGDFVALEKIRSALGLRLEDISLGGEVGLPSYVNSSVARSKTLFPVVSLDRLHAATNPPNPDEFRDLCDKIGSTGIYLYSECDENGKEGGENEREGVSQSGLMHFECRQFPRFSGYPEDPATGIAAAALASSLKSRGIGENTYEFYQGTAMGRRSRIGIRFGRDENDEVDISKIFCSGLVEILTKETTRI